MQVAIITGEASGDRVGGQLAEEIRKRCPAASIWGSGGTYLRRAGAEVLWDSSRLGGIGIASMLRLIPRLIAIRLALQRELLRRRPDVLVAVDAGAFNVPLCRWTRQRLPETRILYYFPSGSWRRSLRETSLAGITDRVATPFPWSETELRRLAVDAVFVGHPLLDLVRPTEPLDTFAARYGLDTDRPVVALLPGSRAQEIAQILPLQLDAARIIHRRVPGVQFLLALAPTVDRADVIQIVERMQAAHGSGHGEAAGSRAGASAHLPPLVTAEGALLPPEEAASLAKAPAKSMEMPADDGRFPLAIVEDAAYDVMAASDVLITTSGTATLEAAILDRPMVITYRLSRVNGLEYTLRKRSLPPYIGMPNILADRCICPEFIQDAATPENLAGEVIDLLLDPERLHRMKEDLRAAVRLLGEPGGAARTAQMVVELAEQPGMTGTETGRPG